MESLRHYWNDVMEIPGAAWIIWISLLVGFVLVAVYCLQLIRGLATGQVAEPMDHLSQFRDLKDKGKLDEEEYSRLVNALPKPDGPDGDRAPVTDVKSPVTAACSLSERSIEAKRKTADDAGRSIGCKGGERERVFVKRVALFVCCFAIVS